MKLKTILAGGAGVMWGMTSALALAQPTLNDCIATALRASPDVRSASARLEAARAAVKEASSAYYPQVGLVGSWTRTDNPPQAFFMSLNQRQASLQKDFNNPADTENARGSVVAQWRVYDSGRREADRYATKMGVEAADYTLDGIRNDLVYQITKAYYGILQARDFTVVQTATVATIEESLRVGTERFSAGSALKTDVLILDVQLSQAREELIRAKNGMQLAVAALNAAVGQDVMKMSDVSNLSDAPDKSESNTNSAVSIDSRPEVKAVEAQIRMTEARAKRARREYLPVVNAFGSVDWDSEPFHGTERSYIAGAAVEFNIFDGYRTRAGVARASAGLVAAQADADKLRTMLALDMTQSRLNEQEARERFEVAGRSLSSAEEALRITQERFKQGEATVTELMTMQVGLTANRTRQVAARYDCLVAKVNVARADGRLAGRYSDVSIQKAE